VGESTTRTRKQPQDRLKKRSRPTKKLAVYLDEEASAEVAFLEPEVKRARALLHPDNDRLTELAEQLKEAEAKRDASREILTFQAVGRKTYRKLMDQHPPTEEQIAEFVEHQAKAPDDQRLPGSEPEFNPETFPLALIHATLVSPRFESIDELEEMLDEWTEMEFMQLWMTAMAVCGTSRVHTWGKD
jgi:hypothetical protein